MNQLSRFWYSFFHFTKTISWSMNYLLYKIPLLKQILLRIDFYCKLQLQLWISFSVVFKIHQNQRSPIKFISWLWLSVKLKVTSSILDVLPFLCCFQPENKLIYFSCIYIYRVFSCIYISTGCFRDV